MPCWDHKRPTRKAPAFLSTMGGGVLKLFTFNGFAAAEIELLSGTQEFEIVLAIEMDSHIGLSDDREDIAVDLDCRGLVDTDTDELGCGIDEVPEVMLAVTDEDVLVDGGVFHESEALGVVSDQDVGAGRVTPPEQGALNAGARG